MKLADLSPKSLRNKFICSRHFKPEYLNSKKLPPTAIPEKYTDLENIELEPEPVLNIQHQRATYSDRPSTSSYRSPPHDIFQETHSSDSDSSWVGRLTQLPSSPRLKRKRSEAEEIEYLRTLLKRSRQKVNSLRTQVLQTKKKLMKSQIQAHGRLEDLRNLTDFPKTFVHMQIRHKRKSSWLPHEKKIALALFYKGPSYYRYLRRKGFTLPAVSTIKSWIKNFSCNPGFNHKIFENLSQKSEAMLQWEKKCILLFDEMSLKKAIEYNRKMDVIEGFEDLGQLGRRPVPAKQALVLMIRGIYSQWKVPVAYFASEDGVSSESLKTIVKMCFQKLRNSGLDAMGMVCDLSRTNQKVFKCLGVTKEKPYFFLEHQKYYAFFDVPHLIKCIRNNFIDRQFVYEGRFIRFSDVRNTYELDKRSKTGRSLLKLTDKHLNPNSFEKMNVKLATQLLSHSVAAAIKTASRTGELKSSTSENTSFFIETMNNLFDALNSTRIHAIKPCNRVLSEKNTAVIKAINTGYDLLQKLHKLNSRGQLTRPDSFDGFLTTINAVKMFASEERENGFKYIFTGRLIQDPLENQFSVYRQKGGYNRNPTVRSFRAAFKMNIVTNLMRPPKNANSGSGIDEDKNIFETSKTETDTLESLNIPEEEDISLIPISDSSSETDLSVFDEAQSQVSLEQCASVYFAGYLVKKCLDFFNCEICLHDLDSEEDLNEPNELLIFYKNYDLSNISGLKIPSNIMKSFTQTALNCFQRNIIKYSCGKVLYNIRKKIEQKLLTSLPAWLNCNNNCRKHRDFILNLLIRTQIYKYCKTFSSSCKTTTGKKKR